MVSSEQTVESIKIKTEPVDEIPIDMTVPPLSTTTTTDSSTSVPARSPSEPLPPVIRVKKDLFNEPPPVTAADFTGLDILSQGIEQLEQHHGEASDNNAPPVAVEVSREFDGLDILCALAESRLKESDTNATPVKRNPTVISRTYKSPESEKQVRELIRSKSNPCSPGFSFRNEIDFIDRKSDLDIKKEMANLKNLYDDKFSELNKLDKISKKLKDSSKKKCGKSHEHKQKHHKKRKKHKNDKEGFLSAPEYKYCDSDSEEECNNKGGIKAGSRRISLPVGAIHNTTQSAGEDFLHNKSFSPNKRKWENGGGKSKTCTETGDGGGSSLADFLKI